MDIDTTLPQHHRENRPSMQLDALPPDEVMMEVEPDLIPAVPPTAKVPGSPVPRPTATQFLGISANSSPPRTFDANLHGSRQYPLPPVVSIAASDVPPSPKLKLDQLFLEWLALPESTTWVTRVLDRVKEGRKIDSIPSLTVSRPCKPERSLSPSPSRSPTISQANRAISPQQTPGSPVSRLFSNHIPFGASDSFPRSPPSASLSHTAHMKQSAISQITTDVDLGQSGTKSPDISSHGGQRDAHFSRSQGQNARAKQDREMKPEVDVKQAASGSAGAVTPGTRHSSEKTTMDKVADGIAGMSAAMDQSNLQITSQERKAESNASEAEPEIDSPNRRSRFNRESEIDQGNSVPTEMKLDAKDTFSADPEGIDANHANQKVSQITPDHDETSSVAIVSKTVPSKPTLPPRASYPQSNNVISTGESRSLPKFYFPCGHDAEAREIREIQHAKQFFEIQRRQKHISGVSRADIAELVVDVIGLPSYFANIIYDAILETFPINSVGAKIQKEGKNNKANRESTHQENHDPDMRDMIADQDGRDRSMSQCDGIQSSDLNKKKSTESDTTMGDVEEEKQSLTHLNGVHNQENSDESFRNGGSENTNSAMDVPNSTSNLIAGRDYVTEEQFNAYYNAKCAQASKEKRLFLALLEPGVPRDYLVPSDFKPLLRALLQCHQGLAFLHATPEFQQRYSETVIERVYFGCTRHHNGRLTLQDIRRSKLLETLMIVDEEEDINKERKYFSYEHFYVLYCRFWELDANHDLQIDRDDLMRYGSHSLTYRIVDRIFGGYARPLDTPQTPGFMSYTDFIWFCLSEEDKTSDTAIDYWFRCVDMDGDGMITMYDMEFFYREQLHRMQCFGHEPVKVRDILCQLLDMINPNVKPPVVRRRDLKRCRLAGNFFNVLFNLNKFFAIEARDPIQIRQEHATPELTDWDRFAALEYLRLSAEDDVEEDESWEDVGEAGNPLIAGEAPF